MKNQTYQSYKDQVSQLTAALRSKKSSLACIYGESEVLLSQALSRVKACLKADSYQIITIEASKWVQEDDLFAQASLFDPRNLYVVTRCETVKNWSSWIKRFQNFTQNKDSFADKILLIFKAEKIAEVFVKGFKSDILTVSCHDPWPNDFSEVLKDLAEQRHLSFTEDALSTLIEANGFDLVKHQHEINKLSYIFAKTPLKSSLNSSDIRPHLGMLRSEEAMKLDRFLTHGDWAKAHSHVLTLLNEGEKPLAILGILSYHCRLKLQIETLKELGYQGEHIAKSLGLPTFVVRNSIANPKRVASQTYQECLLLCREADAKLKSSRVVPEDLFFYLIDSLDKSFGNAHV